MCRNLINPFLLARPFCGCTMFGNWLVRENSMRHTSRLLFNPASSQYFRIYFLLACLPKFERLIIQFRCVWAAIRAPFKRVDVAPCPPIRAVSRHSILVYLANLTLHVHIDEVLHAAFIIKAVKVARYIYT